MWASGLILDISGGNWYYANWNKILTSQFFGSGTRNLYFFNFEQEGHNNRRKRSGQLIESTQTKHQTLGVQRKQVVADIEMGKESQPKTSENTISNTQHSTNIQKINTPAMQPNYRINLFCSANIEWVPWLHPNIRHQSAKLFNFTYEIQDMVG